MYPITHSSRVKLLIALTAFSITAFPPAIAKAPPVKQPLIYRASNVVQNMDPIAAVGVAAYGNINGINVKGTYLTNVHETGLARNFGMVSGDLLLMINNKVTESPEQTLGLITEFSGVKSTLKFARKEGDILVIHESPCYWEIHASIGTSVSSPGTDDVDSYGAVTHAPQHQVTADELEDFMMQLVNNARSMNGGLSKLKKSKALSDMARAYADDMAKRKFFSHKNPEGLGMVERAQAAGITQPISENLGTHRSILELREQVKQCQQIMMNEPANVPGNHRGHILDPENKSVGIGVGFPAAGGVITVQEFSHEEIP